MKIDCKDVVMELRLARAWIPSTIHGEIVKKRLTTMIETLTEVDPGFVKTKPYGSFQNRLMKP